MGSVGPSHSLQAPITPSRTCALCIAPVKYTCPRCRTPSCSLSCSQKHKQNTGCSGERNKAEYIPMNAYGWGAMMRDFCFLEDMGRKVGEWGDVIVRGGYQAESRKGKKDNRRRLPKSHTGWKRKQAARHAKREMLAAYLESLNIEIDLLPVGMERRSLSQSTWDSKYAGSLGVVSFC